MKVLVSLAFFYDSKKYKKTNSIKIKSRNYEKRAIIIDRIIKEYESFNHSIDILITTNCKKGIDFIKSKFKDRIINVEL